MLRRFVRDEQGQTATEYMLVISVVVLSIAAAGIRLVPVFHEGVVLLALDLRRLLSMN